MKKLLAFDLDDTLVRTKSPMSDYMAEVLDKVLDLFDVCIISGGRFEQFQTQVIDRLHVDGRKLGRLHIMPTCGTRYYRYDESNSTWRLQYAEDLTEEQKEHIQNVLESSAKKLGLWEENPAGPIVENRGVRLPFRLWDS